MGLDETGKQQPPTRVFRRTLARQCGSDRGDAAGTDADVDRAVLGIAEARIPQDEVEVHRHASHDAAARHYATRVPGHKSLILLDEKRGPLEPASRSSTIVSKNCTQH